MSALDKAFIKAYTRDSCPPAAAADHRPSDAALSPYMDWYETVPAAAPDGPYSDGRIIRVDDAPDGSATLRLAPHTAFHASPGYSDPAYVGPHRVPDGPAPSGAGGAWDLAAPRAGPSAPQTAWAAAAASGMPAVAPPPSGLPAAAPQAAVPNHPQTDAESLAAGDSRTTGATDSAAPSAAAEPSPRTAPLRTIFSTADADTEADGDVDADSAFSPDWEVDRLAWPPICERLMEAEQRYFRSVGLRLKAATEDSHHVVMVTGARRGEGRTTLALCLARCAAAAGVPTALVDADLKNPQLGPRLGIETPCGWREVVAGKAPLSEAAVSSLEDHLTLFPLTSAEAAEVAPGDPPSVSVLQNIAAHYPLVIVDTGPLGSDGRHLFATEEDGLIDTAIVVRDLRNTTEKKATATAESLLRSGVPAVGIAENFRAADASP
ncbi:MAG TPA: hypothetical protein PLF81_07060 [Candidatus Anammoximicrobium sp.]|nr:hypothetical protein [Candidatus Anammoximicrobium sp.]